MCVCFFFNFSHWKEIGFNYLAGNNDAERSRTSNNKLLNATDEFNLFITFRIHISKKF